ncbi:hypothetical protein [Caulobacter phage Cr30]|uniref:hypothetical protein n=1 Tax=Caulobacter phage Cr30 TaxID=1357714 RepID=UPI0004A9B6E6|nr:hypothetical protein OZ74_gp061 [Caulobacter phage Cr30]AGS80946.1 hypothetical protein [Caulobacter phage Cr30]
MVVYAAKNYYNPECYSDDELFEDLKRLKWIRRLFRRYEEKGDLQLRLILNHVIVLYNLFGQKAATRLLFLKLSGYYHMLTPILEFLGYLPDTVYQIGLPAKNIMTGLIVQDPEIAERLKEI